MMLEVAQPPEFDDRISRFEFHPHEPYASAKFDNSDEIRFPFSQPDVYILPHQSYLYVEGTLSKADRYTLAVNGIAHGFDQIQLTLNGEILDTTYMPGMVSTMKGYASYTSSSMHALSNTGWSRPSNTSFENPCLDHRNGTFSACLPLSSLLGVAEDYRRIMMNVRMELVVVRSSTNTNMITPRLPAPSPTDPNKTTGDPELKITKMTWYIPYVTPSDSEKLHLLSLLSNDTPLSIGFRSWNLSMYPSLPSNKEFTWTIKTSNQLEKPRYLLFGLQTGRKGSIEKDIALFDHNDLNNIRLYVGSQMFPYSRLNLDFSKKRCATLYRMFADFQRSYYQRKDAEPALSYEEFLSLAPIAIIDCSHQVESATASGAAVDVRLEFETSQSVAVNTTAYCLLIHDKVVTYSPLSGLLRHGM